VGRGRDVSGLAEVPNPWMMNVSDKVKTIKPLEVGNKRITVSGKANTLLGLHAVFPFPVVTSGPSE